jgi:hypothetical protein
VFGVEFPVAVKGLFRPHYVAWSERAPNDTQVFKKYSLMKLQMKRKALEKLNRRANEMAPVAADTLMAAPKCTGVVQ